MKDQRVKWMWMTLLLENFLKARILPFCIH